MVHCKTWPPNSLHPSHWHCPLCPFLSNQGPRTAPAIKSKGSCDGFKMCPSDSLMLLPRGGICLPSPWGWAGLSNSLLVTKAEMTVRVWKLRSNRHCVSCPVCFHSQITCSGGNQWPCHEHPTARPMWQRTKTVCRQPSEWAWKQIFQAPSSLRITSAPPRIWNSNLVRDPELGSAS